MIIIKRNLTIGLLFPLLLIPLQILATDEAVTSHSNLTDFSYPNHNCNNKPAKPVKPERLKSFADIDTYNSDIAEYNIEVTTYNQKIKLYKSCINKYIKNGNHDINTIRIKLNAALKEARTNK